MQYLNYPPVITKIFAIKSPKTSSLANIHTISRNIIQRILMSVFVATSGLVNMAVAGDAPLVLYTFNEGSGKTVYDVSGTGKPLNLTIEKPSAVTWNNGSLTLNAATLIATSTAATKVNDALMASKAVTIEAWIEPGNTALDGPARIVTISKDESLRNLTLGQQEASYIARLRTTKTNKNGEPQISTPAGTLNTSLMHVVYTRNARGYAKLYLNGVRQARKKVAGNFRNWDNAYRLALGSELDGSRAWIGTYHQLGVYDRALTATEVSKAYASSSVEPVVAPTVKTVDTVPVAVNDYVSTSSLVGFYINPLTNDTGLVDKPVTLSIISGPSHGSASSLTSTIWYQPNSDFSGTDSITYRITDADGDWSTATVSINVTCSACASVSNKSLNVSWNTSTGSVLGYYVYYGPTADSVTTFASTITGTAAAYSTLAKDLDLMTGEKVCFRVKAYNTAGVSAYSSATCGLV